MEEGWEFPPFFFHGHYWNLGEMKYIGLPRRKGTKKRTNQKNRIQKPKEKWEIPTKKGGHRKSPKTDESRPEKRLAPPKIA
jgi:hypothetical protein